MIGICSSISGSCSGGIVKVVYLWYLQIVKVVSVPERARSLAFSPNGENLAVGMQSGALCILCFHPNVEEVAWSVPCSDCITVLAYSPNGQLIAAGSRDQCATCALCTAYLLK